MATIIKGLEDTRSDTSTDVNFQPAVNKMWWFKEVRYSWDSNNTGNNLQLERVTGSVVIDVFIIQAGVGQGEAATTTEKHWATNGSFLRVNPTFGGGFLRWSIAWLGIEVDV